MADEIVVNYRVTTQDYRRAVRLWYGTRRIIVVDVILASVLAVMAWTDPFQFGPTLRPPFLIVGLSLLVLLPLMLLVVPTWRVRRDPRFAADYRVTFSDEGVQTDSIVGQSRLNWPFFTKARIDGQTCLLYYSARQFMTVPLRAFASDMDRERLCSMVRAKIPRFEQR